MTLVYAPRRRSAKNLRFLLPRLKDSLSSPGLKARGVQRMFDNLDNYDIVAAKYQRRIERFYKTIQEAKHIFFFRTHLTKTEAAMLYQLLKQLFPQKRFSLIAPTKTEHMQQPWNLAGVQEFPLLVKKVRRFPFLTRRIVESTREHGRDEDWDFIFRSLKLI
ncbi:hypothetical protein FJ365_02680 [Candidatus Dependentiae bacterium]|nr:hypothetical protein [Candidatus Dependentiae bacterium]